MAAINADGVQTEEKPVSTQTAVGTPLSSTRSSTHHYERIPNELYRRIDLYSLKHDFFCELNNSESKKNFFVKKKFLIPNCKILGILKTPHGPKNDFFEKMKKLPGDILLRNSETQN